MIATYFYIAFKELKFYFWVVKEMFAGCDNIRKAGHMHICTEKIIGKYSTVSSIVCFSGGKRPGVFFALKSFLSSYFSDNS
jgi:hypothetical protein